MLTLLNVPGHLRNCFGHINLVGIIPGNGKAEALNLNPYLEILVDELLFLSGCTMYSAYNKAPVSVKVKLLLYVLDYPGLNKVYHQHGSGSLSGCHWCHVIGTKCVHLDKVVYLSNRAYLDKADPIREDKIHFVDKTEDRSVRPKLQSLYSETSYRKLYDSAKNKSQASCVATATGCKSTYELSSLPEHNRIDERQTDNCHTIKDVIQNIMNLVTGN